MSIACHDAAFRGDELALSNMLGSPDLDDFCRAQLYHSGLDGAARGGHRMLVERLLEYPHIDYSGYRDQALIGAAIEGHLEIVKLFLADPRISVDSVNHMLPWACRGGRVDIVRQLLKDPRTDPLRHNAEALRWAKEAGHADIVEILLTDERINQKNCSECGCNKTVTLC